MESGEPEKKESGNSNYWIAGAVALVIVAGIIWYAGARKKSEVSPAPAGTSSQNEQPAAAVIEYTDSGFSPQSVTIKVGETVKFTNASSGSMWVASAPHPVHTDYPEFDAKKTYVKGESFSFAFEKAGTWKFHNHMDPTKFGSIVVQ